MDEKREKNQLTLLLGLKMSYVYIWPCPDVVFRQNKHIPEDISHGTEDPLETWRCFNELYYLNRHPYLLNWIPGRAETGGAGMYFV